MGRTQKTPWDARTTLAKITAVNPNHSNHEETPASWEGLK